MKLYGTFRTIELGLITMGRGLEATDVAEHHRPIVGAVI